MIFCGFYLWFFVGLNSIIVGEVRKMKVHQTDFSKGNVYRNILEVSIPMTLAQLLNLLYNIVDRMYIGRIPGAGATALTGVGICFPVITMITAFTYLFGNGGSPLCAMELGRGNHEEAEKLMGNTCSMLLISSVILMVVSYLFYKPILYAFGASEGAALATIISQICSGIWVLRFLTGKKVTLHLTRSAMKIEWMRVKGIMALGISGFMMQFTNGLVQIFCNSTLHMYGGDIYVGVMTVLNSVRDIATMMVHGLTNGASPVMSFNYGEKKFKKVRQAIKFVTVVCFGYAMFVWGIIKIIPGFFIKLFNSDPALLEKGVPALHIYFFGFCFMALQFTGQSVFVALGKAKKATFFSIFRKVIIVVPLTILLPQVAGLGVDGVFWAEPISNLIGGCACFFTMLATILPELKEKK